MSSERWRPVVGHPMYEISNRANVRSWYKPGGSRKKAKSPSPIRAQEAAGYPVFYASDGKGGRTTVFLHRAVLEAFVGPCPPGLEASHIDGNRTDCRPTNLVWETHAENMARMRGHGRGNVGERCPTSKLTDVAVEAIRSRYAEGRATLTDLAIENGVSDSLIRFVVRGKIWTHLPTRGDGGHRERARLRAVELHGAGIGYGRIAAALTAEGFPCRGADHWSRSTARRLALGLVR